MRMLVCLWLAYPVFLDGLAKRSKGRDAKGKKLGEKQDSEKP